MKKWTAWALALLCIGSAQAAVKTESVDYRHGKAKLQGYLAYDDSSEERRPGVIVVHEWKGLGDYARKRAEQLAQMGYVAFAVDMYGKGVYAKDHEEAARLSGIYRSDRRLMRARAQAGLDVLKKNKRVDGARLAAIGYCFGGTTVLELARAGADLRAVVSFHGGLDAPVPASPGSVKASVLVMHGANDDFANGGVDAFQKEMRAAGADWHMMVFGNAVHSFTVPEAGDDPSKGMAYNADADRRSWEYMQVFFDELFATDDGL